MDVQVLEMSNGLHDLPGIPGIRRPEAPPSQPAAPRDAGPHVAARRRPSLRTYTAVSIIAGLGALIWTTQAVPILSDIDPHLGGTALGGSDGGMLLWIAFGLIGSLRVLPVPGSTAVWTFHFPFIAAAMVLGGPTAGAWVGFLSTFERRELESQPWYGVLANHSVMAFAAVVGGLVNIVVHGALASLQVEPKLVDLGAVATGTVTLALVANALAAGTVILRQGLPPSSLVEILFRTLGRMTLAEIVLAWVFTFAFLSIGWWAPLALAGAVLVIWPVGDGPDPLTGLLRLAAFQRSLDGMIGRGRGLGTGGALLMIDLDGFGQINKDPKRGFAIGNEALAEIGRRLRGQMRLTDLAARLGGDEFAMFFPGNFDAATAIRLAERVLAAIRRPMLTSVGVLELGASIGVVMVSTQSGVPDVDKLMHSADSTMQVQKKRGGGVALHEPAENPAPERPEAGTALA